MHTCGKIKCSRHPVLKTNEKTEKYWRESEIFLKDLIETVREQGCVKLKTGEEGIPRRIEITPEYEDIEISTQHSTGLYRIEDVEKIVFIG